MKTEQVKVLDNEGNEQSALLVICPECGWGEFRILVINGHNHLECLGCTASYCQQQGACQVSGNAENKY
jgi:hypothetical protein